MVTTTAQIRDLLLPGLNAVFGDYNEFPAQWPEIYARNTSEMYREVDIEVSLLPLASLRNEGQSVAFSDMGERYQYVYAHKGVGIGFIMTKFAIRDNLYKTQFGPNTRALKHSMRQTKEVYGAAVLNNATQTGQYVGGDGVALLSTAHPIDSGTVSNTGSTQQQLNEGTLQDAITAIRRFQDAAGLRVMVNPTKLIVPPDLRYVATRLLNTDLRPGTSNNDLNAFKEGNLIPMGYRINDFLTDTAGWFVITDCDNALNFFQRDPLEIDMYTDFDTDNLKVKATERYSFGWSNFRGVYGMQP